jgi:ubiquinone/menaquinone biosynthesis C-methylase UbiE
MPPRNIAEKYAELPEKLRVPLWRFFHGIINSRDKSYQIRFMNYGYIDEQLKNSPIPLEQEDLSEMYSVNMYHQTVDFINLTGKDILEVGCGRGGGAYYISRYMKPNRYIGLDLNKKVVKACNQKYKIPGLTFVQGEADNLPFHDNQFDVLINVESSRCYPNMMGFLKEVVRVLKPGGYLLFSDMRYVEEHHILQQQFNDAGFTIIIEKDILPNVMAALEEDNERKSKWIRDRVKNKYLIKTAEEFAGTKGSRRYRLFKDGKMGYYHYVLQKPSI